MKRFLPAGLALAVLASAVVASRSAPAPASSEKPAAFPRFFGALQPRISRDGAQIVFSYQGAICRVARGGGAMTRLTRGTGYDVHPTWSPDGRRIAYKNGGLRLLEAADGSPVPLPVDVRASGTLAFHPDGRRLLGNLQVSDGKMGLAWLDLADGTVSYVLDPPRSVRRMSLSHDGKWIAFTTTQDVPGEQGGNNGPQADLWKVAAEGGEPEKIVRFPARIYATCWAADDESLILSTDLGGAHDDLWQVPLEEPMKSARKLTFGQADEEDPSTSSDGRWLVYTDNREGATGLVVRDLADGVEQLVKVTQADASRAGLLSLKTVDQQTGEPVTARISIQQTEGKFHAPPGALYRMTRGDVHFYCRHQEKVALGDGEYRLRAYRGPEYRPVDLEFRIEKAKTRELVVKLSRWTHQADRGWYSGENHIHANYGYGEWYNTPASMLDQCEGEDLNISNFMVANSDGDGVFDREFFRGRADRLSRDRTILYWNQEYRSTSWGHMTLVNLKQLVEPIFTGFADTTNPWDVPTNADVADRTHLQNGLVNYTHAAYNADDAYLGAYTAKGMPIDVALEKIDSVDLNNSYAATVPLWYRLLNCGFRVAASAGTDCFLNRIQSRLPGSDRAYVQIDGPFSYEGWIEGLRAGRSFVTNGPMLELEVEGKGIGDTLALSSPRTVRVEAKASSQFPLETVELIYNGRVVGKGTLTQDGTHSTVDAILEIDHSGWVALRASGPSHRDHPRGELYAHTSLVYVTVGDEPVASREDAEYLLRWIDRLETYINRRDRIPSEELRAHVDSQFAAAREVYRKIVLLDQ